MPSRRDSSTDLADIYACQFDGIGSSQMRAIVEGIDDADLATD